MGWVKLDDHFADHPKVVSLSSDAFRLHVAGMCWSNRHLTDGFIPGAWVRPERERLADELVEASVWHRKRGGYDIHDFLVYQPSREVVLEHRKKVAGRVAEWRAGQRNSVTDDITVVVTSAITGDVTDSVSNGIRTPAPVPGPPPLPVSVPDPKETPGKGSGETRPTKGSAAASPDVDDRDPLIFPIKEGKTWALIPVDEDAFAPAFPTLDIRATLLGARSWLNTHPTRLKTARGMPAFLDGWLRREANGHDRQKPAPKAATPTSSWAPSSDAELRARGIDVETLKRLREKEAEK